VAALVLILTGTYALAWGLIRGWLSARRAFVPLARDGEPTRHLIESSRPVYARASIKASARSTATAVAWLVVAAYGLFLATVGVEAFR
jgi:hypothetical protein